MPPEVCYSPVKSGAPSKLAPAARKSPSVPGIAPSRVTWDEVCAELLNEDHEVLAAQRYSHLLKSAGLKEFRRLAEAEWARKSSFSTGHSGITRIMESLAIAEGNLDE